MYLPTYLPTYLSLGSLFSPYILARHDVQEWADNGSGLSVQGGREGLRTAATYYAVL